MAPSAKDLRILFQQSGNRCAFPGCPRILTDPGTEFDDPVIQSDVAHIVAQSPNGPRGDYSLSLEDRDKYDNLILLCPEHHRLIDDQFHTYTVERVRQFKADHEKQVLHAPGPASQDQSDSASRAFRVRERLYSSLFPIVRMPRYVYGASCKYSDSQEKEASKEIVPPDDPNEICPFIIRGGELLCFQNLRFKGGPFRKLIGKNRVTRYDAYDWWPDPDKMAWYVSLLNRALNKLTGHKRLNLDKKHHRYYFEQEKPGEALEVSYLPLNQSIGKRQVVWQPVTKKTGKPKSYWYHLAVALRFQRVSERRWCLTIRPELRVTKDGKIPLESERVGAKVTRSTSRTYNYDLLGEIQFWRDFLGDSRPRIILSFGRAQHIVVSMNMLETEVEWPGIPEEYSKGFKNAQLEDDLFSWADMAHLDEPIDEEVYWTPFSGHRNRAQ